MSDFGSLQVLKTLENRKRASCRALIFPANIGAKFISFDGFIDLSGYSTSKNGDEK